MIPLNGISKKIMRWARHGSLVGREENQVLRLKTNELLRLKTACKVDREKTFNTWNVVKAKGLKIWGLFLGFGALSDSSDDGPPAWPPVHKRSYQDQCVFHAQQGGADAVECQCCKDDEDEDEDEAEDEDEDGDEYEVTVSEEDQFLPCVTVCAQMLSFGI